MLNLVFLVGIEVAVDVEVDVGVEFGVVVFCVHKMRQGTAVEERRRGRGGGRGSGELE